MCHASDLHGRNPELPYADLYINTGDLAPDFVIANRRGGYLHEPAKQRDWISDHKGLYRKSMGNPDAPVVCVRGNHDWNNLASLWGGEVYEIGKEYTEYNLVIKGRQLKIGGIRGVLAINSFWSDEKACEADFKVVDFSPELDILVTHQPPYGILDAVNPFTKLGSRDLRSYSSKRSMVGSKPLLHCFGHIHEGFGVVTHGESPTVTFSNAACGYNELTI